MRHPYEIFRKYKYLMKKEITEEIDRRLKVSHINCVHNKKLDLGPRGQTYLCTFGQNLQSSLEVGNLIVCDGCEQAKQCNAYTPMYLNREAAASALAEELKDPKVKMERYPDLIALEWVMDNELHELREKPPTRKHRVIRKVIQWAESVVLFLESWYRKA